MKISDSLRTWRKHPNIRTEEREARGDDQLRAKREFNW